MPLPNVNMRCLLLFRLVIIVLFHCRASSPAQYASASTFVPPPTHAVTSPGLNGVSRDNTSHIVPQCLGLPPLYSHPTLPVFVRYALNLFFRAYCSERTRRPVLIAFSRTLILLLLCSSGDVKVNPGPAVPRSTPKLPRHSHLLTTVTVKALVSYMLTLEASSLSLFYSPGCQPEKS